MRGASDIVVGTGEVGVVGGDVLTGEETENSKLGSAGGLPVVGERLAAGEPLDTGEIGERGEAGEQVEGVRKVVLVLSAVNTGRVTIRGLAGGVGGVCTNGGVDINVHLKELYGLLLGELGGLAFGDFLLPFVVLKPLMPFTPSMLAGGSDR